MLSFFIVLNARRIVLSVGVSRYVVVLKPSVCYAVATLRDCCVLTLDEYHFLHLTDSGRDVA